MGKATVSIFQVREKYTLKLAEELRPYIERADFTASGFQTLLNNIENFVKDRRKTIKHLPSKTSIRNYNEDFLHKAFIIEKHTIDEVFCMIANTLLDYKPKSGCTMVCDCIKTLADSDNLRFDYSTITRLEPKKEEPTPEPPAEPEPVATEDPLPFTDDNTGLADLLNDAVAEESEPVQDIPVNTEEPEQKKDAVNTDKIKVSDHLEVTANVGQQKTPFELRQAELRAKLAEQEAKQNQDIAELIEKARFDETAEYPESIPLLTRDNCNMFTRGNFSYIIGLPGCRKSFLCTAIASAFLKSDGYLGFNNTHEGCKLVYIDTEQSNDYVAKVVERIKRIADLPLKTPCENFKIYALRTFTNEQRFEIVRAIADTERPDFIVIDGVADLMNDPNDAEETARVTGWLMTASEVLNCHILTVIHANRANPDRARGHLGSEADRKCETALTCIAEGFTTKVTYEKTKGKCPEDFSFHVSDNLPVLGVAPSINFDYVEKIISILRSHQGEKLSQNKLAEELSSITGVGTRTAKSVITEAVDQYPDKISVEKGGYNSKLYFIND